MVKATPIFEEVNNLNDKEKDSWLGISIMQNIIKHDMSLFKKITKYEC